MKITDGNVTSPKGFKAAGGNVGIKKDRADFALIASDVAAICAGSYTTNIVKAAPVVWNMKITETKETVRGIAVNAGNANACTGKQGEDDNYSIAKAYGEMLGVQAEDILVCSTGVIGVTLPMEKILGGMPKVFDTMGYEHKNGTDAATAIMTTDTYMKTTAVEVEIGGKKVTVGGMAKGSGMIHPNMATLLSFITTDANISKELLSKAISQVVKETYNMISVDGDTSTNDTVLCLANGLAENPLIAEEDENYKIFFEALLYVNKKLAIDIAKDGEGATKLLTVIVNSAKTKDDAQKIAKSVISSSLFKAALFGEDANWGRVLCAMGYSQGYFEPGLVDLEFSSSYGKINLMTKGVPIVFDEDHAAKILAEKEITVNVNLNLGSESACGWGCDLTYDYVKINGDYRS